MRVVKKFFAMLIILEFQPIQSNHQCFQAQQLRKNSAVDVITIFASEIVVLKTDDASILQLQQQLVQKYILFQKIYIQKKYKKFTKVRAIGVDIYVQQKQNFVGQMNGNVLQKELLTCFLV
eukprot:TRINITY_DN2081_c0_g1_i5.p4 TRINITY_DN2081_c0_g1~~TRINITY_DN2081_c0_g1_i5.p4  ORF type:complete len:121 (-),score=6.56 TRINITY_DN2081_c0_g1_i5:237-599(-)